MKRIIWGLFIVVVIYQGVDAHNTILLLSVGGTELNPMLNYLIVETGTPNVLWAVKAIVCAAVGVFLAVKHRKGEFDTCK